MTVGIWRRLAWAAAAALLSGCGGGGGGGGGPPPNVTVSGTVTFDLVPAVAGLGLDYDATEARPVRGATVEIVSGTSSSVLASTKTSDSGAYSAVVPPNTLAFVRVKAQLQQTGAPAWDFRVADNVNNNALYALDGPVSSTGTAASTRNLHAASGWGGSGYTSARAAAPFAILDAVYESAALVRGVDAAVGFPALTLHWSTENRPVYGASGIPDVDTGEIGTSFAAAELGGIFVLGAEDADTDEYDRHVIVHEWSHYFEYALSRTDNIGGPHSRHDQLDLRVAYSEGLGNALSAIVLDDEIYRDTHAAGQGEAFTFDIEGPGLLMFPNQNPGWYSEESIQEIVYDIVDANQDGPDQLDLDFADVYAVLRDVMPSTIGLTSIFPFIDALKDSHPAEAALIDAIVAGQSIDTIADPWGTDETNSGNPSSGDVLPIYTEIFVNQAPVNVCSTDEFGDRNKLGSRRYLRFSAGAGTYTFTARATLIPAGEVADPDLVLHQAGAMAVSEDSPAANCSSQDAASCVETFSRPLPDGDYVLEVYEFSNTEPYDGAFPPIGRTCFDVSVTQAASKPTAPIEIRHELAGEPALGRPLDVSIEVAPSVALDDVALSLSGSEGLFVGAADAERRVGRIEAGGTYRTTIAVTPLVLDVLYLTVTAAGDAGGTRQARTVQIPVRLAAEKSRGPAALKPDPAPGGGVVHALPGLESPSDRLR